MTAGTLALWIAAAFSALAAWGGLASRAGDARATVATRALGMAAAFGALALGLLADALRRSDLAIDYVVRHTTLAMPLPSRLLAVAADPAGAGLASAVLVLVLGAWFTRRADAPGLSAVAGVSALVLLAAPLAGQPHAMLPWMPIDGQDPQPLLRQPMALGWALAMVGAMGTAVVGLGASLDEWRGGVSRISAARAMRVALALVALQAVAHTHATLAAGISRQASPLTARGGSWAIAALACLAAVIVTRVRQAPAQSRVEAALGACLAALSLALAPASEPPASSVRLVGLLAVIVAGIGSWRGRAALSATWSEAIDGLRGRRIGWALPVTAVAAVVLAVAAGAAATERTATLPSGGRLDIGRGRQLDHLGVSRYDAGDAVVLALAVEQRRGTRTTLGSAEDREYMDARGSVLGSVVRPPAVFPGLLTTFVWLERTAGDDGAELTVASRPDWLPWWCALGLLAAHVIAGLAVLPRDSR